MSEKARILIAELRRIESKIAHGIEMDPWMRAYRWERKAAILRELDEEYGS